MDIETVLIADDHALIRNGLQQVIEQQNLYNIIEADNGKDALSIIRDKEPDVAILDIEMPGMTGFEVAKKVHKEGININIIFLTMFKDETLFNKAMDIGVKGYVLKENTVSEIMNCLKAVMNGKYYLSPAISDFLVRRNTDLSTGATDKDGFNQLTPTEKEVLKLVSEMKTSQEIASVLNVSIKTIQNHRNNMCNKLDLSGAHALLKYAMEHSERI
ncbi:MAG: DNA-binding response regulator [Balneola sp.]|nr:DNA-binding response regulator [Balneola sp.]|tara:strand:+ start:83327 stop:83974 length:648 start_codon:yes stop_codon:yes gene_type:complete